MKLRACLFSLVAIAACGKSKEPKSEGETKPADPGSAAKPTDPKPADKPAETAPAIGEPKNMFGCHAKDPGAQPAARKPENPWQLPFTFAGCPQIPSTIYGTADFGMDGAEAAKQAKAKLEEGSTSAYVYLGKSPFRYQFTFRLDDKSGKLDVFTYRVDTAAFDEMKAGWGEPVVYEHLSDKYFAWYNPEKHLKVTAKADKWDRADPKTKEDAEIDAYRVYYQRYMPLDQLKDTLIAKPIIGKTAQELATAYPEWIDVTTKEQAQATANAVGLDQDTQAKMKAMGALGDSVDLQLPETETNLYHSLVQPDWEGGKVTGYSVLIPFGKDMALKAEILSVIAKQLGKPTSTKKDREHWEYTFDGPNGTEVVLGMSILAEDWNLDVHAKKK